MMRGLGNALVWLGLTVGVPGALYTTTLVEDDEVPSAPAHALEDCSACRVAPGRTNPARPPISSDQTIALVDGAGDDEPAP